MATITPTWTENQGLHSSGTVAAAATATDDIDLDTTDFDAVHIVIEVVFGGTPDADCTIEVFGSANSGTDDDTEALYSFSLAEATSTTKRISFVVKDVAYIAVALTNNDSTDTVTYESWYAGRKWTSV